jgi:NAD(P)-dependent dehydrogenase (short-subunit alcohol dehydrogenase family)
MGKLEGKTALVTGGNSGIGLATAQRFVEEGCYVFITGRREAELEKAKALIGRNVSTIQADIARLEDLDRMFARVREEKGVLDILVANAAFSESMALDSVTPEHFDQTYGTNVRGTFFTVQKALPLMTRGGSIVLVTSGLHLKAFPMYGIYASTKAALRSLARTLAAEMKDRNIRVNTMSPGVIETPMVDNQFTSKEEAAKGRELFAQITPLGRIGRPEEAASAIFYLASDESSFTTGFDLVADGGITQL